MNKKLLSLIICLFVSGLQIITSQESKNQSQKPFQIGLPSKIEKVPSIASRIHSLIRPDLTSDKEMPDGRSRRSSKIDVVIGKGSKETTCWQNIPIS